VSIPIEDLTSQQLRDAYKELQKAKSDGELKSSEEMANLKALHLAEVANLKEKYGDLEQKHAEFKALHAKNPEILLAQYTHDARLGLYTHKEHPEWGYFCAVCLRNGKAAQTRTQDNGWVCDSCNAFFPNPDYTSVYQPMPGNKDYRLHR
jgi:ribosomal protein L37AE/L43A